VPGIVRFCHVRPPSTVRQIVPEAPLAQATRSLTALTPRSQAVTPLDWRVQARCWAPLELRRAGRRFVMVLGTLRPVRQFRLRSRSASGHRSGQRGLSCVSAIGRCWSCATRVCAGAARSGRQRLPHGRCLRLPLASGGEHRKAWPSRRVHPRHGNLGCGPHAGDGCAASGRLLIELDSGTHRMPPSTLPVTS
jgi:hypothetical protein